MASRSTTATTTFTCKCLNVKIHPRTPVGGEVRLVNPRDYRLTEDQLAQAIFQGSNEVAQMELDVGGVRNEQPLLASSSEVGNWSFFVCLNCKTPTHCCGFSSNLAPGPRTTSPTSPSPHVMLVNVTQMISDTKKIHQLSQSQDFSPLYQIVLPTTWGSSIGGDRFGTGRSETFSPTQMSPPEFAPTSPQGFSTSFSPNSTGRRISSMPSPSIVESQNMIHQLVTGTLQRQLSKYLQEEETALELKIKKFEEEQREAFESKADKARRDRSYLLNLLRSNCLDNSTAVKTLNAQHGAVCGAGGGARSRRESAPARPINIGPSVNYPGVPTAPINIGSPLALRSPGFGGLVETDSSRAGGSPATVLKPMTLASPNEGRDGNFNNNNNNNATSAARKDSPTDGLFAMDVEETEKAPEDEEAEEEELEEVGADDCSPFEAIESSDAETDPDDNSLEDLRREDDADSTSGDRRGIGIAVKTDAASERKPGKYSISAPMKIAAFPQMNKATAMGIASTQEDVFKEEAADQDGAAAAAAPEPEPDPNIAASMQALAMSHRDDDDPEAIFGERPRRRLNTLELYQIRQFKKPTISKQSSASSGRSDEGFSPGAGSSRSGR